MEALHRAAITLSEMQSIVGCLLSCWFGFNTLFFLLRST
jgi:hypothetical protein